MQRISTNVIVLLYNYGVILSTAYIMMAYGIDNRWTLLVLTFVFAIFWTVYFRVSILDKIIRASESDDTDE